MNYVTLKGISSNVGFIYYGFGLCFRMLRLGYERCLFRWVVVIKLLEITAF